MPRPYVRGRPAHDQRLSLVDRQAPKRVEGCQFVAHVDATSLRFDVHGALKVSLLIPAEFADLGLDLRFLAGVPLSVDVQRWKAAGAPVVEGLPAHPGAPPPLQVPAPGHPSGPRFRREHNGRSDG